MILYIDPSHAFFLPILHSSLGSTLTAPKMKVHVAAFANSVYPDEVAHIEPPHLNLLCLPSSLWFLNYTISETVLLHGFVSQSWEATLPD